MGDKACTGGGRICWYTGSAEASSSRLMGIKKLSISDWNQELKNLLEKFVWCHQESNRGHKDFQSFALPTELWHLYFLICVCKGSFFSVNTQIFQSKNIIVADFYVTLHVQIARLRDLAQLVAHYVRDVGVGRSSRLFPTKRGRSFKEKWMPRFLFYFLSSFFLVKEFLW